MDTYTPGRLSDATRGGAAHTPESAQRRTTRVPATMRAVLALLPRLSHGALALTTPDGATRTYGNADGAAAAALAMRDWSVATDVVSRGDVGFAEAYIDGRWDTPDLVRLLTLL
ncbi:MAG: SAM-dependent methyltransferase, partial [Casimicrobiaceae bacterium]